MNELPGGRWPYGAAPEYRGEGVDLLKKVVEVGPGGMIVVTSDIAARIMAGPRSIAAAAAAAAASPPGVEGLIALGCSA